MSHEDAEKGPVDVDEDSGSDFSLGDKLPEDVAEQARNAHESLLPAKSSERYQFIYNSFETWKKEKNINAVSKDVMMAYFSELSKKYQPPTLWATYSMLKSVLQTQHNINIGTYAPLIAFIKRKNEGYRPKKSMIFTAQDLEKFPKEAPNEIWLATKVITLFGIYGGLRLAEIANIKVEDVEDHNKLLLVKIPVTKTKVGKSFTIEPPHYDIIKQYEALPPKDPDVTRYFLNYQSGKCTKQVIGRNKIANMPKEIAKFLNLPNPQAYTGHCFRRSSASILANAGASTARIMRHGCWRSEKVENGYIENSLRYKNETAKIFAAEIAADTENIPVAPSAKKPKLDSSKPDVSFESHIIPSDGDFVEGAPGHAEEQIPRPVIQLSRKLPLTLNLTNCSNFEIHFKD